MGLGLGCGYMGEVSSSLRRHVSYLVSNLDKDKVWLELKKLINYGPM